MKKIFLVTFIIAITTNSFAQFLTSSAEGKSSIPLPLQGIGIAVDIGKSEVAFGVNNYERVFNSKSRKFKENYFFGFNLSARNQEGLADLFNSGDLVAAGDFLGFAGFSFTNKWNTVSKIDSSERLRLHREMQKEFGQTLDSYVSSLQGAINNYLPLIQDMDLRDSVKAELYDGIISADGDRSIQALLEGYRTGQDNLKEFRRRLLKTNEALYKSYNERIEALHDYYNPKIEKTRSEINWTPWRLTPFIMGGIQARGFTRFLQLSRPDFSRSFGDTLFRGGTFGVGLNLQVRNFWFGITYSYLDGDNFINLSGKEYTLRTIDTSGNQTLTREKKITAYTGNYSKVETNELNMDLVGDFFISDSSRLLANLYLRGSVKSRNTDFLMNYTNIGTGLYFLGKRGKFLGGLYVELPDVNNNLEKAKPAEEMNIRPPFKKLTFGIVTKFNISSVFGFANRPAKPD